MVNIRALVDRLKSIQKEEIFYRIAKVLRALVLDPLSIVSTRNYTPPCNFDAVDYPIDSFRNLPETSFAPSDSSSIYNFKMEGIQANSKWRDDLYHDIKTPKKYYFFIDRQDYDTYGDAKYTWEVSRFYHLPILAAKAVKKSDQELASVLKNQLTEWMKQNPYLRSINWASGIEVGIRGINWCVGLALLNKHNLVSDTFFKKMTTSLYQHAYFLRYHLPKYSSANNHLIAELVGLLYISSHIDTPEGVRWQSLARQMLVDEIDNQFFEDGGNQEQSTHYHAFTLELYLFAAKLLKDQDRDFPIHIYERLEKAASFLKAFYVSEEYFAEIGDSDYSHIIKDVFNPDYNHFDSVLISSALLFERKDLLPKNASIDFVNSYLIGTNAEKKLKRLKKVDSKDLSSTTYKHFKYSGYVIFRDGISQLIFDAGSLGMGSTAAHGHADMLQFCLNIKGYPVFVDPGTYQYHRRYRKWRDYFRGTSSHNTVTVDGMNQAEILGRMNWGKRGKAEVLDVGFKDGNFKVLAKHDSYLKQGVEVIHTREIRYRYRDREYHFIDSFEARGFHSYEFTLHLHPNISNVVLQGDELRIKSSNFGLVVLKNSEFKNAELIYGDEEIPFGWFSTAYDKLQPTYSLRLKLKRSGDFSLHTYLNFEGF